MNTRGTVSATSSMARAILLELLDQVRGHTIRLIKDAPASCLFYSPPGTSNHMLWHAGHAVWLQDVLGEQLMTGQSKLPDGWAETFGMNCRPVRENKEWPERREVVDQLDRQWQRLRQLLKDLSDDELEFPRTGRDSIVGRFIHGLHDEARHHGEMYLLFKQSRPK